jgi:hypothetical protein
MSTVRLSVRVVVIALVVSFALTISHAEDITYDAFMGIKWGTPSNEIAGLHFIGSYGSKDFQKYRRPGYRVTIEGVVMSDVVYIFWHQKLIKVEIGSIPRHAFSSLVDHFIDFWGKPSRTALDDSFSAYCWTAGLAELYLSQFQKTGEGGAIWLTSQKMIDDKIAYDTAIDLKNGWVCNYYGYFSKHCFDNKSIIHPSKDITRAILKHVTVMAESEFITTEAVEIRCDNGTVRRLKRSTVVDGKELGRKEGNDDSWTEYEADSPYGRLCKKVCETYTKK